MAEVVPCLSGMAGFFSLSWVLVSADVRRSAPAVVSHDVGGVDEDDVVGLVDPALVAVDARTHAQLRGERAGVADHDLDDFGDHQSRESLFVDRGDDDLAAFAAGGAALVGESGAGALV
ncbi:hypothetical protein AB0L13_44870 [Saccharopolyspora shandongensis]|uniref:hypothetical protein n=1 Tax=Saccharopolyspora shandongensis TaxID=418495 RepID=UPI003414437A